jgi:hypothetical protein
MWTLRRLTRAPAVSTSTGTFCSAVPCGRRRWDAEAAAFRIEAWLSRQGAASIVPEAAVSVLLDSTGRVRALLVSATLWFDNGNRLELDVRLDDRLNAQRYTFDLIKSGTWLWGYHGHPEPHGFHHKHLPSGFSAEPDGETTFETIERLLHG